MGILDPFFTDPFKNLHTDKNLCLDNLKLFIQFLLNIPLAPYTVAVAVSRIKGKGRGAAFWTTLISLSVFLMLFVLLHLIQLAADGAFVFGWIFYIGKYLSSKVF